MSTPSSPPTKMQAKTVLLFLTLCVAVARSEVLLELDFNAPYDPSNPSNDFTFQFFDPSTLSITNTIIDGRLIQTVNPYTVTAPSNPVGGAVEHVKMLQLSREVYYPGNSHGIVSVTARMGAQHYNMSEHPFPSSYVTNPQDDVRLGSCALNAVSLETFMVFDFMITNEGIYALYERLPFARSEDNYYRAFTQMKRLADRKPNEMHLLKIEYNAAWGVATWYVDGRQAVSVSSLGTVSSKFKTMIDLGGEDQVVHPNHLSFGWGCFTLLDAVDYHTYHSEVGLVDLCAGYDCGYETPESFYDEDYVGEYRLWGQGSAVSLGKIKIENR